MVALFVLNFLFISDFISFGCKGNLIVVGVYGIFEFDRWGELIWSYFDFKDIDGFIYAHHPAGSKAILLTKYHKVMLVDYFGNIHFLIKRQDTRFSCAKLLDLRTILVADDSTITKLRIIDKRHFKTLWKIPVPKRSRPVREFEYFDGFLAISGGYQVSIIDTMGNVLYTYHKTKSTKFDVQLTDLPDSLRRFIFSPYSIDVLPESRRLLVSDGAPFGDYTYLIIDTANDSIFEFVFPAKPVLADVDYYWVPRFILKRFPPDTKKLLPGRPLNAVAISEDWYFLSTPVSLFAPGIHLVFTPPGQTENGYFSVIINSEGEVIRKYFAEAEGISVIKKIGLRLMASLNIPLNKDVILHIGLSPRFWLPMYLLEFRSKVKLLRTIIKALLTKQTIDIQRSQPLFVYLNFSTSDIFSMGKWVDVVK